MKAFLHSMTAALVAYGPWGIFLLGVIDSVGVPLPAAMDVLLIGLAAAAARHPQQAYFAALMAVIGSVVGNIVLFLAVREGRRWLGAREPSPGKRRRFGAWFQRYGMLTVFVPAVTPIVPIPLKVFVVSAGATGVPVGKFLVVIAAARLIRYFGLAYLGLQLGKDAEAFLVSRGWIFGAIAALIAVALYLAVRFKEKRAPMAL